MENIKEILKKNNFFFKKGLGQNFITDTNLLSSVVIGSGITKEDTVIEIGCGAGTLTAVLADNAKKVIGYEIDERLEPILEETVLYKDNAEIIFTDIMKVKTAEIEEKIGGKYKVVANLPYYITTPIIMKFVEQSENAEALVIMVQKEVAERLCAKEDTEAYGGITASINVVADCKIIKNVPKTMFFPIPKVDSAVVKITFDREKYKEINLENYRKTVKCAFLNRRKTLENNLILGFNFSREQARKIIADCGFDEKVRGETLGTDDFVKLSSQISENI